MPTIQELKKSAHTPRRDLMYRFMGNLAYYPAKVLIYFPITPNQVTILWILGQILSSLLLLSPNFIHKIIGLIAFQSFFIIDCSDGIIARYKKQFSLNGIYLDRVGHYIANSVLLICYTISIYQSTLDIKIIGIGALAIITFLLNKSITLNPSWYPKHQREYITESSEKSLLKNQPTFIYNIFALFRLEYFLNVMFFGTLFNLMYETLTLYAILFSLELARKIIAQYNQNKKKDTEISTFSLPENDFSH